MKNILSLMSKLCVECGTCISLCPVNAVDEHINNLVRNVRFNYDKCISCLMCIRSCPVIFKIKDKRSKIDEKNKLIKIFSGFSLDCNIRYHGASGGVATALAIFILKKKLLIKF